MFWLQRMFLAWPCGWAIKISCQGHVSVYQEQVSMYQEHASMDQETLGIMDSQWGVRSVIQAGIVQHIWQTRMSMLDCHTEEGFVGGEVLVGSGVCSHCNIMILLPGAWLHFSAFPFLSLHYFPSFSHSSQFLISLFCLEQKCRAGSSSSQDCIEWGMECSSFRWEN